MDWALKDLLVSDTPQEDGERERERERVRVIISILAK
jgi:hypothetical protein